MPFPASIGLKRGMAFLYMYESYYKSIQLALTKE